MNCSLSHFYLFPSKFSSSYIIIPVTTNATVSVLKIGVIIGPEGGLEEQEVEILKEAGAKVEKAWNGQEAVALFSQNPAGSFDAILMDVMMPVMDGMEATQRIRDLKREDAASIPIIAMTAQTTADIRETCRKAGMDDYIAKPIREEELAKVIRKSWKVKKV